MKAHAYAFEIGKRNNAIGFFLIHVELCQISRGLGHFDLNSKEGKRKKKERGTIGG